jgi:hypothetical protein
MHPDAKLVGIANAALRPHREDLFDRTAGCNAQAGLRLGRRGRGHRHRARGETGSGTLGDILAIRATPVTRPGS